jgi:hypothetical protein
MVIKYREKKNIGQGKEDCEYSGWTSQRRYCLEKNLEDREGGGRGEEERQHVFGQEREVGVGVCVGVCWMYVQIKQNLVQLLTKAYKIRLILFYVYKYYKYIYTQIYKYMHILTHTYMSIILTTSL